MATELLLNHGALSVEAIVTHAVLSGKANDRIDNSSIENIYISDSIYHSNLSQKFAVLQISELISTFINDCKGI